MTLGTELIWVVPVAILIAIGLAAFLIYDVLRRDTGARRRPRSARSPRRAALPGRNRYHVHGAYRAAGPGNGRYHWNIDCPVR